MFTDILSQLLELSKHSAWISYPKFTKDAWSLEDLKKNFLIFKYSITFNLLHILFTKTFFCTIVFEVKSNGIVVKQFFNKHIKLFIFHAFPSTTIIIYDLKLK